MPPKGDPALILSHIKDFFNELAGKSLDCFPPQARTLITKMADDFSKTYADLCEVLDKEQTAAKKEDGTDEFDGDSPMVEALRYKAMKREQKKSIPQIADEHGLSQRDVRERLKLFKLTKEEQRDVHSGKLDPVKAAKLVDKRDRERYAPPAARETAGD